MRKKIVIPTIVLAVLLLVGVFYVRQHDSGPVPKFQPSAAVAIPTIRSARTEVVVANHSARPQTDLLYSQTRNTDVRLVTIRTVIDTTADVLTRQKAVRALPADLLPEHRKLLTDFLAATHEEDSGQSGQVLKNDLMDTLVGQNTPGRGLADLFIGIYQDKAQNIVIRDYALQHLALLNERLDGPMIWESKLVQTQQKLIQETLWQCAEARDSSIAGTALLALARLSETHDEVDRNRLAEAATAMTDGKTDEAARVTAFQVCARLKTANARPLAVNAAQTDSSSIVRTSAIGALGLIGNEDDVAILDQIAGKDARFRTVAMLAMKKIQERTR
jgi:hypothetical protein